MDNPQAASQSRRLFEPAGGALVGIDIKKCFKDAFCLNILVNGKTGVGKSALINSLVGSEICKENDPGMDGGHFQAGTLVVSETKVNIDNVLVTVYDSPGLQDGTQNDEAYLQDMYEKCKDVNLFIYCMEMTASRFTESDEKAIKLITSKFEHGFWKKCVLVLTKANMVRIPPKEKGKEREYHKRLYTKFMSTLHERLIAQGVPKEIARSVPCVSAGYYSPNYEDERYVWYVSNKAEEADRCVDFLAEFWMTCFDRTAESNSQIKFIRATTRQRIKQLSEASKVETLTQTEGLERLQTELHKQIVSDEEFIKELKESNAKEIEEIKEHYSNFPVRQAYGGEIVLTGDQFDRMTQSSATMPPKSKKKNCELCLREIKTREDSLKCSGPCGASVHRYCAAVTTNHYKEIVKSGQPFSCLFCTQKKHQDELTTLHNEVATLKQTLQAQVQSLTELNSTQKGATYLTPSLPSNSKPSDANALKINTNVVHKSSPNPIQAASERKFNVVIFGLKESPKGSPRNVRILKDMESACEIIKSVCPKLSEQSICDCSRLGKYSDTCSRPLQVKLARSCDVSLILSSRHKLSSLPEQSHRRIYIKPYMNTAEKQTESTLLKERRSLIKSGVSRQAIKIRGNTLLVNNENHGTADGSIFETSSPLSQSMATDLASRNELPHEVSTELHKLSEPLDSTSLSSHSTFTPNNTSNLSPPPNTEQLS